MNMKQLRQDKADNDAAQARLKVEGRKLLAIADRTDEQQARVDAIARELDGLAEEAKSIAESLSLAERLQDEEKATALPVPGSPSARVVRARPGGRLYADMFPGVALDRGGFRDAEEFLASVHLGLSDPRLVRAHIVGGDIRATSTTTTGSGGGFSVPTEFFREWLDSSLEDEIVRPRADVRPMQSSEAVAPGWDDGNHSASLYGGFTGGWAAEGDDLDLEEPKLRQVKLKARKLGILTRASNELVADGVGFESQLGSAIVKALGWFLDGAFLTGTGGGQPLGIVNAPATIEVAKEGSQTAATINYTNLAKMFARMHPASIKNSVWVANSTTIPQLLALTIAVGDGGSHVPVLSQAGGQFTILTRPVIFTEKAPALGSKADIGLYDFSQYVIGLRADFALAKSQHAGFASDTSYYRGIIRVDGQPKLSAPVTPKYGDTLSPFVVLGART